MAASEEWIAEEVQNFPVYTTKVTGLKRKKLEKERMIWGGECLRLRRNYKGNLDLLKRCSEKCL